MDFHKGASRKLVIDTAREDSLLNAGVHQEKSFVPNY